MSELVLSSLLDNGVLTLALNRPQVLNALDEGLTMALLSKLTDARTNKDIRAIVITGEGWAVSGHW